MELLVHRTFAGIDLKIFSIFQNTMITIELTTRNPRVMPLRASFPRDVFLTFASALNMAAAKLKTSNPIPPGDNAA